VFRRFAKWKKIILYNGIDRIFIINIMITVAADGGENTNG